MGKLSVAKVKSAAPGRHPDGEGLYLIVRDTGSRQWLLRIQADGKRRDLGLGTAETADLSPDAKAASAKIATVDRKSLTLAEAREKADAYRRMIKAGIDPVEERKKAPPSTPTFEIATRACHEEMKAGWRNDKHTVDEKIRTEEWPDVLLERWSNERARSPGWVQKPLACDFIAYAYAPAATCVLLPVPSLQRAWRQHGRQWIGLYGQRRAENAGYTSVSVPVPRGALMQAIVEAMFVS